jgi:thioredoxin 1
MDSVSIQQYRIAQELEEEYPSVKFCDIEFDDPSLFFFHTLAQVEEQEPIPFILYFRNGKVVKATSGFQTKIQVINILEEVFSIPVHSSISKHQLR